MNDKAKEIISTMYTFMTSDQRRAVHKELGTEKLNDLYDMIDAEKKCETADYKVGGTE